MKVKINVHRFILLCCFLLSSLFLTPAQGQTSQIRAYNEKLVALIKKVEKNSDFIFNYTPQLLSDYSFSGTLDLSKPDDCLKQMFYHTPFQYERNGKDVLIFLPEKEKYNICGYVVDQANQQALPFANIYAVGTNTGTQSNEEGYFELSLFAHKNQMASITYLGYQATSFMLQEAQSSNCPSYTLRFNTDLYDLSIIVTDYLFSGIQEGNDYSAIEMDYAQLSRSHSAFEHDILKTAQLLPGITSIDESATKLQIRGGTADQNLIIWEGAPLYEPGHLFGMISAINPFVVDQVKVYKGVYETNYDNRVGGIIDMSLTDSVANRLRGGFGTTLSEAHAYLDAPIIPQKLSLLVSGRKSLNDYYSSPTLNSYADKVFQATKVEEQDEEEEEAAIDQVLDFYDWNAKLIFSPADHIRFKASYLTTTNSFDYLFTLDEEELSTEDVVNSYTDVWSLSLAFPLFNTWDTELSYFLSNYENRYLFTFAETTPQSSLFSNDVFNDITDRTFAIKNHYRPSAHMEWLIGYDYNFKAVNFNIDIKSTFEPDVTDANSGEGTFHNFFTSFNYTQNKLILNGGLRLTHYLDNQQSVFSPRLNLRYALHEHLNVKLAAGIFHQYINQLKEFGYNDLDLNNPVWVLSYDETGTANRAEKLSIGLVYNKKGWLLDAEAYWNATTGLSSLSPIFGSSITVDDYFSGSSIAKGIDLLIKKKWKRYSTWLNYSLSQNTYLFEDIQVERFPASNDHRHKLSFINTYQHNNWGVTLTWQYHTGLPITEAIGIEDEYDEEEEEAFYYIKYGEINAARLNDYQRLDLSINYRPSFKEDKIKAEFAFSIINLLDTENTFSRESFIETEEIGNIEIPVLITLEKQLLARTPQLLMRMYW